MSAFLQITRPVESNPRGLAQVLLVLSLAAVGSLYTLLASTHVWDIISHGDEHLASVLHLSPLFGGVRNALLLFFWRLLAFAVTTYTLYYIYADPEPYEFRYFDNKVVLMRRGRYTTFTMQNFAIIGLYFGVVLALSTMDVLGWVDTSISVWPQQLAVAALVLFKICFPLAFLVSTVVTHVLFPAGMAQPRVFDKVLDRLLEPAAIVVHDFNVIFMLTEMFLCAPFDTGPVWEFMAFPILFGVWYGFFALVWFFQTRIFFYHFLDFRHEYAWLVYVILLAASTVFCSIEYVVQFGVRNENYGVLLLVVAATYGICQIRDPRDKASRRRRERILTGDQLRQTI